MLLESWSPLKNVCSDFLNIFFASIVDPQKVVQTSKSCLAIKVCSFHQKGFWTSEHAIWKNWAFCRYSMFKSFLRLSKPIKIAKRREKKIHSKIIMRHCRRVAWCVEKHTSVLFDTNHWKWQCAMFINKKRKRIQFLIIY